MLLKISKFFLYSALFAVVWVNSGTFFPFIGVKYYFFRVTVELALLAFILWWGFEAKEGEMKRLSAGLFKPLAVAVSIFVLVFLLASVFAYDPHAAFWSNYERGEGAFQMIHYYAFFLLAILIFQDRKDWLRAFGVAIVSGLIMILYGLAWVAGLQGFVGPGVDGSFLQKLMGYRFQGSLGNAAYVAPFIMFILFYLVYFWLLGKKNLWKNIFFSSATVFFLFFFALSGTRGAFLGMVAAIFAYLIYIAVHSEKARKISVGALLLLVVLGATIFYFRESPVLARIPGGKFLQRFSQIDFSQSTFKTRLWTWGSAIKGWQDRPLLGWGPENFSSVFDKYFDTRHFIPNVGGETWFDRAHSVFFGYLVDTGILGLLSYLAIFFVFFREFIKKMASGDNQPERTIWIKALIFVVPIGYLVQGLALFDVLPIYMHLMLFLGFAHFVFYNPATNQKA